MTDNKSVQAYLYPVIGSKTLLLLKNELKRRKVHVLVKPIFLLLLITGVVTNMAAQIPQEPSELYLQRRYKANALSDKAEQLKNKGDRVGAWQAAAESVKYSPDDPLLMREFCDYSFDAGQYRDVVWSAQRLNEDNNWLMSAATQYEWGISVAVLGDYMRADSIMIEGIEKYGDKEDWLDGFREWHITLTYINKDFIAAGELARYQPVNSFKGAVNNYTLYDLLAKNISQLCGGAQTHQINYALLNHLCQIHRLVRDGLETYEVYDEEAKRKAGEFAINIAWRTIDIYNGLPLKPLPPQAAFQKYQEAMEVIGTQPPSNWHMASRGAVDKMIDVTRMVPWWSEVHYNLATILKDSPWDNYTTYYHHYTMFNTIASQELMYYLVLEPKGAKADDARKTLKKWKQKIPGE